MPIAATAHELLAPGHSLPDHEPMVDDRLEVERRDTDARITLAVRRLADVSKASPERDVGRLDRVLEDRAVRGCRDQVAERGVALELGQPERGPNGTDDRVDQVGEDVLGVVELDAGEIAGVAGDIGDEQERGLRSVDHHPASERSIVSTAGTSTTASPPGAPSLNRRTRPRNITRSAMLGHLPRFPPGPRPRRGQCAPPLPVGLAST
jgi:hypothetical protein